eukprot:3033159-Rhodomonas_salina.9
MLLPGQEARGAGGRWLPPGTTLPYLLRRSYANVWWYWPPGTSLTHLLRLAYAKSGTEVAYGGTNLQSSFLRHRYAKPGADIAYATRPSSRSCYGSTPPWSYAPAKRCAVLT